MSSGGVYYHCVEGDYGTEYEEDASIHQAETGHQMKPEYY